MAAPATEPSRWPWPRSVPRSDSLRGRLRDRSGARVNALVRWAAVEAVQRLHGGAIGATRVRLTDKRGASIAKVAAARKLLTLVYYGLRDGHVRCLARSA